MSMSLLFAYIINIPLHPLVYVGYVVVTTLLYAFFGFLFDLLMVPLFARYKIFSAMVYWIPAYPICRLPHELLTYTHFGYTIFASDILSLIVYLVFFGSLHGVIFGVLVVTFLRSWYRRSGYSYTARGLSRNQPQG